MDGALERAIEDRAGAASQPTQAQPAFAAILPLRGLPRFTPRELIAALNRIFGQEGAGVELVPELTQVEQSPGGARVWHRPKVPPRIGVRVAGITVVVEGQDRPAFGPRDAQALDFRSWPTSAREIGRARAHVRVAEAEPALAADLDLNHDRAAALTAVAAAAAEVVEAAGIVWESSGVAVPADELAAGVRDLIAGYAPLALWIGARHTPRGSVATRGLYPLLGAEIEVRAPGLAPDAARRVALDVAADIVDGGRPPAEGAEIASDRRTASGPSEPSGPRLCVRYGDAEDGELPAVILEERSGGLPAPVPAPRTLVAGAA